MGLPIVIFLILFMGVTAYALFKDLTKHRSCSDEPHVVVGFTILFAVMGALTLRMYLHALAHWEAVYVLFSLVTLISVALFYTGYYIALWIGIDSPKWRPMFHVTVIYIQALGMAFCW